MVPRKPDSIAYLTLLAGAAILAWLLFVPPVVGLANNGDFHKVIGGFSLAAPVADEYYFAPTTYHFRPENYLPFLFSSTEQALAFFSIGLNALFHRDGSYDLRCIGFVHALFYLAALWLALPLWGGLQAWRRVVISVLVLFVFFDAMYLVQLNSFFTDTPSFLFLLLTIVFGCRVLVWRRRWDAWGLVVSSLLMTLSKAQHVPLGILVAVLLLLCPAAYLPGFGRVIRVALPVLLLCAAAFTMRVTPRDYMAGPLFSQVFFRILPQVPDPRAELPRFGLDASYLKYVGKYFSAEGVPNDDYAFAMDFLSKMSYGRLMIYLASHPAIATGLVVQGLGEAGRERVMMGNYDRSAGLPPYTECHRFSVWSDFKATHLKDHGPLYLGCVAALDAVFVSLLLGLRRRLPAGSVAGGLVLIAMMYVELLGFTIGDALDYVRHGFVFVAICDVMFVAVLTLLIHAAQAGLYRPLRA